MRVHKTGLRMLEVVRQIVAKLPAECKRVGKHLMNACESAFLNLGEGLTSYRPGVKINAFDICRKETGEVRKALAWIGLREAAPPELLKEADELTNNYIGMLVNMIKQQEGREDP